MLLWKRAFLMSKTKLFSVAFVTHLTSKTASTVLVFGSDRTQNIRVCLVALTKSVIYTLGRDKAREVKSALRTLEARLQHFERTRRKS